MILRPGKLEDVADKSEAVLRDARYKWLTGLSGKEEAAIILLGHHADDVLETQLMALFSGSGPAGLCSPMPVRHFPDNHVRVRPLLPMKRSTIETTLTSLGASWREDSSNEDSSYTRNWLRKELLPTIAERFPQDIYSGSERTRKLMQESLDAIDKNINELGLDLSDSSGFEVCVLKGSSKGTIRRILLAWWMRHFSDCFLSTGANDNVVELIHCGSLDSPVSIGVIPSLGDSAQALFINSMGRLILRMEKTEKTTAWTRGCHWVWQAGPIFLPKGGFLTGEIVNLESTHAPYKQADPGKEAWLTGVDGSLWVRQWQPGDRYRPLGSPGSRKLQDVFGDAKLNSEQKQALPVILNNKGEILWVPGFPPAEDAKVRDGINSALRLTYWVQ